MAEDYYSTLGVSRDASQAEIQKAYLKLARKYHPDVNPDDESAKKRFQEVQQAFDVLKDPSKRELYDRYGASFESMASGGPTPGAGTTHTWQGTFDDIDLSQFFGERFAGSDPAGGFADLFGQFGRAHEAGTRRARRSPRSRGRDMEQEVRIPLQLAVTGGTVNLTVMRQSGPESLAVKVPAGVDEGRKIRLRGQGEPGLHGGTPGDLFLVVRIEPHPYFQRRGDRLDVKLPVTLREAAEGAKVDVPTPKGTVTLKIPAGSSSGTRLRIKGHGVPTPDGPPGDLFAELQIVIPANLSEQELEWLRQIDSHHPSNPRADLRW